MKILLYLPHVNGIGTKLLGIIEGLAVNEKIEIYRSIDSLAQRLRKPTYDIDISILIAANKKQLSEVLLIKEEIRDIKIILILPDRESDTISGGHELYPRFVSYIDSDFKDVGAVLEKIIKNKHSEECTK
ncbi:MAG: hypothetical protein KJ687_00650 [Proteobacteria bacterium]|nr:hypothetical protein [Pseudomonadota bacterium]